MAALLSACTKDKNTPPTTGDITGTITPAYAVTQISLIPFEDIQLDTLHTTPGSDGNFKFNRVKPGIYFVVFATNPRFNYQLPIKLTVVAGATNELGNIAAIPLQPLGTASISGVVSPASAVVHATITGGNNFSVVPDPNTGAFSFPYLPAGNYSLTFIARSTHVAPAEKKIELRDGQRLDLGTLTFSPNQLVSKLSCNMGPTALSFDTYLNNTANKRITASYSAGELMISGSWTTGTAGNAGGVRTRRLTIALDNVNGPGTYICKGTVQSEITYLDRYSSSMAPPNLTYSSSIDNGNGTVIITAFDPVAKTLTGTFRGSLKAKTFQNTVVSQDVTEGVFDIKY
ncbi:MAG: hypothetical protein ABW007_20600 [Chitinophagaceae bacterium]